MKYNIVKSATCKEHAHNTVGKVQSTGYGDVSNINVAYKTAEGYNNGSRVNWMCGPCKVEVVEVP
jgi:hypothetical protein